MKIMFNRMKNKRPSIVRHKQGRVWMVFLNLFGLGIMITNCKEV